MLALPSNCDVPVTRANAISEPSGDHAAAASKIPGGVRVSWRATPVARSRTYRSSFAFEFERFSPRANAIDRPSGDQSGSVSGCPSVMRRASPPSAFTTNSWPYLEGTTLATDSPRTYAISLPSADHVG